MDYQNDVVDPGDRFSALMRQVCLNSHHNSPAANIFIGDGGMRAMDGFRWKTHILEGMLAETLYEAPQADGAGGKPQFFTFLNDPDAFYKLGWEIITMNADDMACRGGFPVFMLSSIVDVKSITNENWHLCEALVQGFEVALRQSGLILMTGETAIMKHSITAFCDTGSASQLIITWNGTCHGLAAETSLGKPKQIQPGMKIIGFKDEGYRCNGGTQFTEIINRIWGHDAVRVRNPDAVDFVRKLTAPSQSYARTISRLNGWNADGNCSAPPVTLHGVAHITGGGVWSKLGDILPEGVGANLHSMPEPTQVLREAQELSRQAGIPMSDQDCYGTFHGGCGLLLICEEKDAGRILHEATQDGHDAYVVGETFTSPESQIMITSRFANGGLLSSSDRP